MSPVPGWGKRFAILLSMHPNKLTAIADGITTLAHSLTPAQTTDLQREDELPLQKLIDTVSTTVPWNALATRGDARRLTLHLIRNVASGLDRAGLEAQLTAAEADLAASPQRLVITPVQGLWVQPSVRLGHVTFHHLEESGIETLIRTSLTEGGALNQILIEGATELLTQLKGLTVSLYEARGSTARLQHDAIMSTRASLQVLRGLTMLTHADPQDVELAVSGDERIGAHLSMMFEARGMSAAQVPLENVDVAEFHLYHVPPQRFEGLVLAQLDLILRQHRADLNGWQRTLLRCFEWLGTAQVQQDPEGAFLNLAVVLEILFTEQGAVAETIADAIAFLTAQTVDDRLARRKEVKDLYAIRSSIMHGRTSSTVYWDKVHELRDLLKAAMEQILPHATHWTERADLTNHLNQLKYG